MALLLVVGHAVVALVAALGARALGRRAWAVVAVAPVLTLAWLAVHAGRLADGEVVTVSVSWVPELGLGLDLRLDGFAALMILLVSGVGLMVDAYGARYFADDVGAARTAALLSAFAGAMLGLVLSDGFLTVFVFWELTSVTSYLLIGGRHQDEEARSAAQHALLITGLGGLVLLAGLVLLGQETGVSRLSELAGAEPAGAAVAVAGVLVLVGAFTKSAQYPFHAWLPGAMVAPTPVSAYLHSAAMVKAGIYLIARLAPVLAPIGPWRPIVVVVGLVTMLAGGLRALRPFDLKQLLAFGTISQLGFLTVLLGIGQPEATAAGCALLLAHGLFKATLFMAVGIVDHETGTRDIRGIPHLGEGWRATKVVAVLSAASMAAVPPLAGFIAKESAFAAFVEGSSADRLVLAGLVAGSVLTVAYTVRLLVALLAPERLAGPRERPVADHAPAWAFVAPAVVLAGASLLLGVVPGIWSGTVDAAANSLDPDAHAYLSLWHGLNLELALSGLTLVGGALLYRQRQVVERVQARRRLRVTGADVYEATLRSTLAAAGRVTSIVQSGSLPVYTAVILGTAVLAPTIALLGGRWWPGWPDPVGNTLHLPIVALLVGGGLAATMATRRFAAALLLGVVGYAMALLFVVQGAPDLALTQFAVETLSVVVFLLVLRVLPDRFERRAPALRTVPRVAVATGVGIFVTLFAIAASGWRTAASVSREMIAQALPEGEGRNVVNVILVDIRGLDTLGEVTVLLTAGLGIAALARAGRGRPGSEPVVPVEEGGSP